MGEFFNQLYLPIFQKLFGVNLSDYLSGVNSDAETNLLIAIGFTMLGISLLTAIVYYYIVNKPKLSLWWGWAIFMGINAVINFFVGWQWCLRHEAENWPNSIYEVNVTGEEMALFGVANMLLSMIVFLIFSLIIKWGSRNCSHAPF